MSTALTLGTAGHIDHGKTALIEALTGVNTDRLPQERDRGISIELGFARLELPSGRSVSVVDVPGHERFVRTMVAGATGIDLFLLVVAADDGVMPQTREHLDVLQLLEIEVGVVAITKADAVDAAQIELATAEVAELLAPTPYAGARILPVSARDGRGLEDLRMALDEVAAAVAPRGVRDGPVCMHVDRSFTLRGIGTVVTGTLWSGRVEEGQEVRIEPAGTTVRVRQVHVHDERVPAATAGSRVALNVAGVERRDVSRGDVVVAGAGAVPTHYIDAAVTLLPGARPLRQGMRLQVHHGTRDVPARIAPLGPGFVQLRLERPLMPVRGDRFVLRQIAPPGTVGGGVVVDPAARKHGPGEEHLRRLCILAGGDPLDALRLELETAPSGLEQRDPKLLAELQQTGEAAVAGHTRPRWFTPAALARARRDVLSAISEGSAGPGAVSRMVSLHADAVSAVLEDLADAGTVRERDGVFSATGAPRALDDPVARRLAEGLAADGLAPRAPVALAAAAETDRETAVRVLDRLAAEGAVVRLRPGIYMAASAFEAARDAVVARCEREGAVTIAQLRDDLGTSRKAAQAVLEHLDSRRVTRRRGDAHVLRSR